MNISGNTILITGGGSGIGRALAEAFHAKGNQVIVAGRRPGALDGTTAANPGMRTAVLDIEDRDAIPAFAARIAAEFPTLNVLVNNAGIMRRETLTASPVDLATTEATVATNLLGPIRLTAAFLPHLRRQPGAALVQIAGAGKRPVLYCRDFKLGARHSTLQAQVDLGHPDVPVRIVPCGCDASIRYRRS